jgi:hypothetical protein
MLYNAWIYRPEIVYTYTIGNKYKWNINPAHRIKIIESRVKWLVTMHFVKLTLVLVDCTNAMKCMCGNILHCNWNVTSLTMQCIGLRVTGNM